VQYLPFEAPQPSRRIGLLYRRGSYREATFRALAETIRQSVVL
jgi:DNA-binding transcriptional LysR family regulator